MLVLIAVMLALLTAGSARADAGGAYGFGDNRTGQLGSTANNGTDEPNPTPLAISLPGATGPPTEAAVGDSHTLLATSTGQLYAFGNNFAGQLGSTANLGTITANPTPSQVTLPGATGPVVEVSAGQQDSFAVTDSGQLYSFGVNTFGELGYTTAQKYPNATPTLVPVSDVAEVAAGDTHTLALTDDGSVYAWGLNNSGELGSTTNNGTSSGSNLTPNPTPTKVAIPGTAAAVAAGNEDSFVITTAGQLYAFGTDGNGELGTQQPSEVNPTPTLVSLPGATGGVARVSAGDGYTLALTTTGQLYAFGDDTWGQLGFTAPSGQDYQAVPTLVTLPGQSGTIVDISAQSDHSTVITSSGQVYTFGENPYGQLGSMTNLGTGNPNSTPTPISISPESTLVAQGCDAQFAIVLTGVGGVSVSAGDPVPEPSSGTVAQTFTVSLGEVASTATTVQYQTSDGTATSAANNYTSVTGGSVTIPAGQRSATITIQVGAGSGVSTVAQLAYSVTLTGSSGAPIDATGATAQGMILIPEVSGTLTDGTGAPVASHDVTLSGAAGTGQAVKQVLGTNPAGQYQFYADPGTYTVTPDPATGGKAAVGYEPVGCPVSPAVGHCGPFPLAPGAAVTVSFKLATAVVNSTADEADPEVSLDAGVCDTTPSASQATCTLRAAIQLATAEGGGGTIAFDIPSGGTPKIVETFGQSVGAAMTIDATTQPGGQVELAPAGYAEQNGLDITAAGVTVKGIEFSGFPVFDVLLTAHDTMLDDTFGAVSGLVAAGSSETISFAAAVSDQLSPGGGDVIQGNTFRGASGATSYVDLTGPGDTFGGSGPGAGNTLTAGRGEVSLTGAGSVAQGNTLMGVSLEVGPGETVGGPTPSPGTGAGNNIDEGAIDAATSDVIQGNKVEDAPYAGIQVHGHDTVGGRTSQDGNLVENSGLVANGGVLVVDAGGAAAPSSDNVIEHNTLRDNGHDGGVVIKGGTGNQVTANTMSANTVGINLGGGPYLYNHFGSDEGPNNLQAYPNVLSARRLDGRTKLIAKLDDGHLVLAGQRSFRIDVYAQPSCAENSVAPGQGLDYLGTASLTVDHTGSGEITLSVADAPAGDGALTLTATAQDGSTSEFSPCLSLGHSAPKFAARGVVPASQRVAIGTAPASAGSAVASAAAVRKLLLLPLDCPVRAVRFCTGSWSLSSRGPTLSGHFRLAPGQLAVLTHRVGERLISELKRAHRLHGTLTVTAHDGGRKPSRKQTRTRLTLVG